MKITTALATLATAGLTAAATADITSVYVTKYTVTATQFDGTVVTVNVQDLYLSSNDAADSVLNIYNFNLGPEAQVDFYQSQTAPTWSPGNLGGPFDTEATRRADSFVTIGGFEQGVLYPEQSPGSGNGIGLDPNFGGENTDYPGMNAGWYNGSPPSLAGQVGDVALPGPDGAPSGFGLGVLIGRFAYQGDFSLDGSSLETTWNQGLGTPGQQLAFTVVPAPGSLALLGLVGLTGTRRRQ